MAWVTHALILDLVEWAAPGPRPDAAATAAWPTSCPRLPVREDGTGTMVDVTPAGRDLLRQEGRAPGP